MNWKFLRSLFIAWACTLPLAPLVYAEESTSSDSSPQNEDRIQPHPRYILESSLTAISNSKFTAEERIQYFEKAKNIGIPEEYYPELSSLLQNPRTPKNLHCIVLLFLLQNQYPNLDPFITSIDENNDPLLFSEAKRYLGEFEPMQALSLIVRNWIKEDSLTEPKGEIFQKQIEKLCGKSWDASLLEALNSKLFSAKAEALQILLARMGLQKLQTKLLAMHPEMEELLAIQTFAEQFDYLPTNREQLITTTLIYRARQNMLPDAAQMSLDWTKSYGYAFNICDFHLLSRLSRDPLRSNLNRTQIVLDIGQLLKKRKHVRHTAAANANYNEDFWLQADNLTMADLWNLYLLNEMLSRPLVQTKLRLMADGDLSDTKSAWGGLVFYLDGRAQANLYPPDKDVSRDDMIYQPSKRVILDGRDSLCRFIAHFEKIDNASRAGPTAEELADAKEFDYYGLILTRVGSDHFCAHYYNPAGRVISLGILSFR